MKLRFVLFWGVVLVLMAQSGCDVVETPEEKVTLQGANLRGTVVRRDTQAPISGALVYDAVGLPRDTTKADGSFILRYPDITQPYRGTVLARKDGFEGDSLRFTLNPGFDTTVTLRLRELLFQVPPSAREPAQIAFISASTSDIFVSGVGALENAILTYEVRDSLGTPIDSRKRAYATYSLNFFPHTNTPGGTPPRLIPSADSTDNAGRLRVNITSGTKAGVAQVVVRINTPGGPIFSQPVRIGVNSGFPDQRHFSLYATRYNFPGLQRFNERLDITVQVADKYSNPVQAGTVVYFSTTHGSIQTQGAVTGADGFVTKQLISGRPTPEGPDVLPGLGPGFAYVKAQTLGENGTFVADSILVLWTGEPIITKLDTITTFTVPNGGGVGPFRFRVADRYGHPVSAGTSISVTAEGALVTGDALVVMRDTFASGPGTTDFVVTVRDSNPNETDPPTPTILKVTVTHAVYGSFTLVLATGTVD
jgi:hypothetical protein